MKGMEWLDHGRLYRVRVVRFSERAEGEVSRSLSRADSGADRQRYICGVVEMEKEPVGRLRGTKGIGAASQRTTHESDTVGTWVEVAVIPKVLCSLQAPCIDVVPLVRRCGGTRPGWDDHPWVGVDVFDVDDWPEDLLHACLQRKVAITASNHSTSTSASSSRGLPPPIVEKAATNHRVPSPGTEMTYSTRREAACITCARSDFATYSRRTAIDPSTSPEATSMSSPSRDSNCTANSPGSGGGDSRGRVGSLVSATRIDAPRLNS